MVNQVSGNRGTRNAQGTRNAVDIAREVQIRKATRAKRKIQRKRCTFFFTIVALILVAITLLATTQSYGSQEQNYITVRVQQGDTLWEIARQHGVENDIRKTVHNIQRANQLQSSVLHIGMDLKVPIAG